MLQVKDPRHKLRIMMDTLRYQPDQCEEAVEENWISLIKFNFKKIKDIKVPIHLIHGEKDYLVSKSLILKFHALIPKASLDFIADAGHIPPLESPDTLAKIILNYSDTPS
jgi:pimeloyl-ACP methyl ester carboxylesterase